MRLPLPTGPQTIQFIPISQYSPPVTGSSEGDVASVSVDVAGSPKFPSGASVSKTGSAQATVSAAVDWNGGPAGTVTYFASTSSGLSCGTTSSGAGIVAPGGTTESTSGVFDGLAAEDDYYFVACANGGFGTWTSNEVTIDTFTRPGDVTGTYSYTVDVAPSLSADVWLWDSAAPGIDPAPAGQHIEYSIDGVRTTDFALTEDRVSTVTARYCNNFFTSLCGSPQPLSYAAGTPPTLVRVTFPSTCPVIPVADDIVLSAAVEGSATRAFDPATLAYSVTFTGLFSALPPASYSCTP